MRRIGTHISKAGIVRERGYALLVFGVGLFLLLLGKTRHVGGWVEHVRFTWWRGALHLNVALFGLFAITGLIFVPKLLRLPALLRIALSSAFFIWLIWITVWVVVRRTFGIELSSDIVWELLTNRNAIAAVGLGDAEFYGSSAFLFGCGILLGVVTDRVSRHTGIQLARRGFLLCLASFAFFHLFLRGYALAQRLANHEVHIIYHEYIPVFLRVEQLPGGKTRSRATLPSLESKSRTDAYLEMCRTRSMPPIPRPRNIVWLNLESLRFDAITPEAMPKLSAYASRFQIRFDREHWSGANVTQFALFAELTGLSGYHLHDFARARVASPFLSLLAQNGYRLRVAKKHQLDYVGLPVLIPRAAAQEEIARGTRDVEDKRMVDAYLQDRATRNPAVSSFDFLAFDATHWPYCYTPEHALFKPAIPITGAKLILGLDVDLNMVRNRYKNACHFADEQIGRILADLEARGDLESSIIIILGDHGEEFHERGQMGHASVLNDFQGRTPLWIHLPGVAASKISTIGPTMHLDIVPTLLQTLGFSEDALHPGPFAAERTRPAFGPRSRRPGSLCPAPSLPGDLSIHFSLVAASARVRF